MKRIKRIVLGILAILALAALEARADGFSAAVPMALIPLPSTPDISITGTSTTEYRFTETKGPVEWLAIKNDCRYPIWFSLTPGSDPKATEFPIRLNGTLDSAQNVSRSGESFSGPFRVHSIAASGDGANTCTFTLQLGTRARRAVED